MSSFHSAAFLELLIPVNRHNLNQYSNCFFKIHTLWAQWEIKAVGLEFLSFFPCFFGIRFHGSWGRCMYPLRPLNQMDTWVGLTQNFEAWKFLFGRSNDFGKIFARLLVMVKWLTYVGIGASKRKVKPGNQNYVTAFFWLLVFPASLRNIPTEQLKCPLSSQLSRWYLPSQGAQVVVRLSHQWRSCFLSLVWPSELVLLICAEIFGSNSLHFPH